MLLSQFADGVYLVLLMGLLEGYFVPLYNFFLTPENFDQKVPCDFSFLYPSASWMITGMLHQNPVVCWEASDTAIEENSCYNWFNSNLVSNGSCLGIHFFFSYRMFKYFHRANNMKPCCFHWLEAILLFLNLGHILHIWMYDWFILTEGLESVQ